MDLREKRLSLNLTQKEVAKMAGLSTRAINRYENNNVSRLNMIIFIDC